MRIAHLSDVHLGFRAYQAKDPFGVNQRELDVENAFEYAVDWLTTSNRRPDVVVVAGDFFDAPKPSNRTMSFAIEQLYRLLDSKIHVVLVGGNHDAPRRSADGHPFDVLDSAVSGMFPYWHVAYAGVNVVDIDGVRFVCVPHDATWGGEEGDVMVIHAALQDRAGRIEYAKFGGEPIDILRPDQWSYIAAGDYHECAPLHGRGLVSNAWYSGSLENVGAGPWGGGHAKKFIVVEDVSSTADVSFVDVPTRPVFDLGVLAVEGMDVDGITELMMVCADLLPDGAIVRQRIEGITKGQYSRLRWEQLKALKTRFIHYHIVPKWADSEGAELDGKSASKPLPEIVGDFAETYPVGDLGREPVKKRAVEVVS